MTSDTEEWLDNTALLIEEDGHVLDDFNHTGDVMGEYNEGYSVEFEFVESDMGYIGYSLFNFESSF